MRHSCIRACGFYHYSCDSQSPLNYAISISPIIASLFSFRSGTKSRFQSRGSTVMLKREWWSRWLSYSNIRNTARQIPVERSRGKQESRECLHFALLRAAECLAENFRFLGRICGREYRKPGGSTKLNTTAQSRGDFKSSFVCELRGCIRIRGLLTNDREISSIASS